MEICNTAVVCGNTAVRERRMGMAPKEFATVLVTMEGAVAMGDEAVMKTAFVEPVMKVPMVVVKDDERRTREEGESDETPHRPPPPRCG
jgi:hypothetical protein